jgi:hypothetical protein
MRNMFKKVLIPLLMAGVMMPIAATSSDHDEDDQDKVSNTLVRFEGGIGSQPLRAGGTPNVVHGINPGGAPWVIRKLKVEVKTDGKVVVEGRGLLLGGGNNIGYSAGVTVRGRLICSGVFHDTKTVMLPPNGDFEINDIFGPIPPNPCANAVFLIVSAGGSWFAAGIPKT